MQGTEPRSPLIASDNHLGRSLASADTDYSADCIEFCPFQGFENIFVCGTYQVIEPAASTSTAQQADEESEGSASRPTERTGRLLVYRIGNDEASVYVHALSNLRRLILRKKGGTADRNSSYTGCEVVSHAQLISINLFKGRSTKLDDLGRPVLAVGDATGHITLYVLDSHVS